jgi:sporulation protein YlmC with PRC-barrel domain
MKRPYAHRSGLYAVSVDYGNPISYLMLNAGADVISRDGERVGKVEHVLADPDIDVFDGLVIDIHLGPGGQRFADAGQVDELYERAVVLRVPATEIEKLPKPEPAPAVMESHGVEDSESPLQGKLHRAWDLVSGNY